MSTVTEISNAGLNQVALPLARAPKRQPLLPVDEVAALAAKVERDEVKGWEDVYRKAISDSGLFDSEVADAMQMDKGQLSKTLAAANLQTRRINEFCRIVGNSIVIQVFNYRADLEAVPMQSLLEKELEQERAKSKELEAKLAHFQEFMQVAQR